MNKRIAGIVAAVVLVALAGAGTVAWQRHQADSARQTEKLEAAAEKAHTTPIPSAVKYAGVEGKSALELLKAKDPKVATSGEGANAFVTTINGHKADSAKKEYWAFYVNGAMSNLGAGAYITKDGDQVEWKIAKY